MNRSSIACGGCSKYLMHVSQTEIALQSEYFILYKMTYVPALNLGTVPVMNFIPIFNDYATFRVKFVMVFIQAICDISAISKNCNCDIWMGRSTGNN